jgi:hypothetical protein
MMAMLRFVGITDSAGVFPVDPERIQVGKIVGYEGNYLTWKKLDTSLGIPAILSSKSETILRFLPHNGRR